MALNFGKQLFGGGLFKNNPDDDQVLTSAGSRQIPADQTVDTDTTYTAGTGVDLTGVQFSSDDANINHDALSNHIANQHRAWENSIAQNVNAANYTDTQPTKEYWEWTSPSWLLQDYQQFCTFKVPHDFNSLTSIALIIDCDTTDATVDLDLSSTYGVVGEDFNNHAETDTASTYNLVANKLTEIDVSGVFSSLAVNDIGYILITNKEVTIQIRCYGLKLRYT